MITIETGGNNIKSKKNKKIKKIKKNYELQ